MRDADAGGWLRRVPLYGYLIAGLWLIAGGLLIHHWATGTTPDRAALTIAALDFDVYWYGIWIVGGIALGAYVVSRLAWQQGTAVFHQHVPANLRDVPLATLDLPDELHQLLAKRGFNTVGDLLRQWGFDVRALGVNETGLALLRERLQALPGFDAAWLARAPWRVWNPDHVWSGMVWGLVLGVVGARLYHVLTPSPSMAAVGIESPLDYLRNPYRLIDLRSGGLGIYGGIAGGALGLWIYTRRQRIPTLAWADLAAIALALGQTFGRWGNYFNQELYGRPTSVPWAIAIEPRYRLPAYADFTTFHPAFLYESIWNFLTFLLLLTLWQRYRRRLLPGDLMAVYLMAYAIGRTLLETVRLDSATVQFGGLTLNLAVATLVSLLLAAAMAVWVVVRHRRAAVGSGLPD
ncbi:MAG: prolipoprotein diacylglyceryl transferase [Anaerolineales bacterium]|nr:prolipoprotein diacylglyceryl transferase [Anaerolineales bacterium]